MTVLKKTAYCSLSCTISTGIFSVNLVWFGVVVIIQASQTQCDGSADTVLCTSVPDSIAIGLAI